MDMFQKNKVRSLGLYYAFFSQCFSIRNLFPFYLEVETNAGGPWFGKQQNNFFFIFWATVWTENCFAFQLSIESFIPCTNSCDKKKRKLEPLPTRQNAMLNLMFPNFLQSYSLFSKSNDFVYKRAKCISAEDVRGRQIIFFGGVTSNCCSPDSVSALNHISNSRHIRLDTR